MTKVDEELDAETVPEEEIDLASYFYLLFMDSSNFTGGYFDPAYGVGAGFRGSLEGMTTVVVEIFDQGDGECYVTAFAHSL